MMRPVAVVSKKSIGERMTARATALNAAHAAREPPTLNHTVRPTANTAFARLHTR